MVRVQAQAVLQTNAFDQKITRNETLENLFNYTPKLPSLKNKKGSEDHVSIQALDKILVLIASLSGSLDRMS